MLTILTTLSGLPLAAEGGAGIRPFLIGGAALIILFSSLAALLAFGRGREHS